MLNKVILIGKVQEVQVTFTDEGLARLALTIRTWQGKTSEFHKVVFFDPTVERAYKYYEILKDKNYNGYLYVEGKLNYRTYQGQDGVKRKYVSIIARQIRFINPTINGESSEALNGENVEPNEQAESVVANETIVTEPKQTTTSSSSVDVEDLGISDDNQEDIPF